MEPLVRLIIIAVLAYLLGAFPTAVVISKRFFGFDIRTKGSGNMGSTNAFRVLGVKWGIVVQVIDILKGVIAVVVISHFFEGQIPFENTTPFADQTVVQIIAGVCAVIGHIFSAFVGFRGGKGINTAAGMLLGIAPVEVAVIFGLFLLTVSLSGYISLGSIVAAIGLPTTMLVRYNILDVEIQGYHTLIFFFIGLSLLVIYTHRSNIKRLLSGTENRFQNMWLLRDCNKR